MLRGPLTVLLAAVLLAPAAAAFSSTKDELYVAYPSEDAPAIVASGQLALEGVLSGGLLLGGADGTVFPDVPTLRILQKSANGGSEQIVHGATVEIHGGALLWTFAEGANLQLNASAPYALALALPNAPIPAPEGQPPRAGFLFASERVDGSADWERGVATLAPLDAVLTVRDARGQPLPGWDVRTVNADASLQMDPAAMETVLIAEGAFSVKLKAAFLAGASARDVALGITIAPAQEERFTPTVEALDAAGSALFGEQAAAFSSEGGPLTILSQISGLLNGALLVIPGLEDGGTLAPPLAARLGEKDFPLGPLSIVRGDDMRLSWAQGETRIEGEPTVALGRDGFAVDEPRALGIFPIVSLFLWALALGAIVWFFVKRPPKGNETWSLRLASFGASIVVLLVVLFLWDRSFQETFGVGVVSTLADGGFNSETLARAGVLAMLELVPWGIASLLFALPVRIMLGVGLRYVGRGKSFKGVATAGGLIALAVFGPLYALWCFNLVWGQATAAMMGG